MKITLDYRNPTPSHCDVAFFINGKNVGTLRLGQEDILTFQSIMFDGPDKFLDEVLSTGNPNWTPEGAI